jgi:hypothetical protein
MQIIMHILETSVLLFVETNKMSLFILLYYWVEITPKEENKIAWF